MAVYERNFIFCDRIVPLRVREHRRARRFTLRIDASGQRISLTIPPAVSSCAVQRFIEKHQFWIEERLARLSISCENLHIKEGATIPLLGVSHIVTRKEGRGVVEVVSGNGEQKPQIIIYSQLEYLPRRVADFLKKQAEITITPLVAHYAYKVGRKVKSIHYKDIKSRWGSCSTDGRLSFSWRLIMAPKEVVEYVVAHEVAHLIEMNHGEKFWTLCERLCSDYKMYRTWLKKNGYTLHRINFH
ncbi:hypothetical protein X471_00992 [Bartonella bacilliformis str. Heidi Mejia]|uniref:M48 family metallopeptidase n=1 Tax=Bartonella bacilliformis TaxID=774 RepID=UPI00044E7BBD|nr:SprT family zinc-dependent metalloprotease [Bartonella bacilliformis]EYS90859.1 hypothetical protein X471_00992 [Bartonella bacilliformis str. Heidi Mejia]KEG17224.1 hypothetical protein H707_01201 [Bartonella bacilliformis Hosp800-02]KEG21948.1 hypothetical protein H708_01203 [Bartonella bacilliformis VAB9028]KEG23324.1 hypothetical protein H706_01214 [Bartonella bacilliformis CAR600-02]